jgi:hypothetical protein
MMWSRKIPEKGGNDPAFGCRALACALVVPALCLLRAEPHQYQKQIKSGCWTDPNGIATCTCKNHPRTALCAT